MKTKIKYENTENFIKEESSEENQIITEDEDDYNINGLGSDHNTGVNRRRKMKKSTAEVLTQLQHSPGNNPKNIYTQSANTS
jgi:hypothetical protein